MGEDKFVARAVITHLDRLRAVEGQLRAVHETVGRIGTADLFRSDMLALAATVLEYRPDIVLELGRGWGASTALFRLIGFPTISICQTKLFDLTMAALAATHPIDWTEGITAIVGKIEAQDYRKLLGSSRRIFIFWDAHGFDVADIVLGRLLPDLVGHQVLVACHDLRDSRYFAGDRLYGKTSLWRRQEEPDSLFVRLGNVHSTFEQIISIVDFTSRNRIPLISPSHELAMDATTRDLFLHHAWWPIVLWHYFELPADKDLTFPQPRIAASQ
jgi:hypothetical protein